MYRIIFNNQCVCKNTPLRSKILYFEHKHQYFLLLSNYDFVFNLGPTLLCSEHFYCFVRTYFKSLDQLNESDECFF